jgi:hypothetical protein
MMLSDPTKNAPKVIGMVRPRPCIRLISFSCAATMIAPAAKNSVILPKACIAMCIPPPMIPSSLASIAPSTMYESWLIVE